jgi:hypothetical protein
MTVKRLRPISAEIFTIKRSVGTVTRWQTKAPFIPLEDEDEDAGLNPETGEPLLTLEEMLRGDEVGGDEV